jgi:hypothetical protein
MVLQQQHNHKHQHQEQHDPDSDPRPLMPRAWRRKLVVGTDRRMLGYLIGHSKSPFVIALLVIALLGIAPDFRLGWWVAEESGFVLICIQRHLSA